MQVLRDLYRYNSWANARVFAVCRDVALTLMSEEAPGTYSSIEETLKHMVGVEDVYLAMLQGRAPESLGPREAYEAHDIEWFADRATWLGDAYQELLATFDGDALSRSLTVPWFDFPLKAYDGLLQVLSHSAQHRAQVFSVLGSKGLKVPDLDYVVMVGESRHGA